MTKLDDQTLKDRARGMLVGLAVGDALGAPVEFLPEPSSEHIKQMGEKIEHFHKNYRAAKGVWTDDTEMALCIADSLLVNGGYDSYDMMRRFTAWSEEGYRTADGRAASDVGRQTMRAIEDFARYPVVSMDEAGQAESAGNGPIMRLAPVVLANMPADGRGMTLGEAYRRGMLATEPDDADGRFIGLDEITPTLRMAELSCRETHDNPIACMVTELFATMLYSAMCGLSKLNIAAYCSRWILNEEYFNCYVEHVTELIDRAVNNEKYALEDLGGYIVDTFAIALWGLMNFDSFREGMLAVIRLGGDTDTNAACYGQLAGAYYGYEAIPAEWRDEVYLGGEITELAEQLLAMPACPVLRTRFEGDEKFEDIEE